MSLEILFVLILVAVNGLFAMAEFALLKVKPNRLGEGASASAVEELLDEPNRFLSTVQISITAVGTLAGAFGGATLADEFGSWLNTVPAINPHGEVVAVLAVWLSITYVSLVLGELVPKRLALRHPHKWALRLGRLMRILSRVFHPIVKLLSFSTNLVLRVLGHKPETTEEVVTEAEVRELIARAVEHGELKPLEHQLTESVFLLDDRKIEELMTPRERVRVLEVDADPEDVRETLRQGAHSRYLVVGESMDDVIGVVLTRDILERALTEHEVSLKELCRPVPHAVPDMDVLEMLEMFRETASSIVVVMDDEKTLRGILTAQDLLEAFAGRLHKPGQKPLS